jgi:hypothetical protein
LALIFFGKGGRGMFKSSDIIANILAIVAVAFIVSGCSETKEDKTVLLEVPRGYVDRLEINHGGSILKFGPFVGYYFKPQNIDDLTRLTFLCYNKDSFYTKDLAENALLFKGDAVFKELSDTGFSLPSENRINPVFFSDVPGVWLEQRPKPKNEYLHFHSCYDSQGPVLAGYWIRHTSEKTFTYDMGGRIGKESPLYHAVTPGIDKRFARVVEFDRGESSQ